MSDVPVDRRSLVGKCLWAANGDPLLALLFAVKVTKRKRAEKAARTHAPATR